VCGEVLVLCYSSWGGGYKGGCMYVYVYHNMSYECAFL
jgi:hypothetical protein